MGAFKVISTGTYAAGTTITSEVVSTAPNGTLKNFSGNLTKAVIENSSLTFTAVIGASNVTATDNGNGVLAGTGVTGTINYNTGSWTLSYTSSPDNSSSITCTYKYLSTGNTTVTAESTGLSGVAGITKFRGKLAQQKIIPGSVFFHINLYGVSLSLNDNKERQIVNERLSGGYVNYNDGTFLLNFLLPPDTSSSLTVDYKHRNGTYNDPLLKLNTENYNQMYVYNSTGSSVVVRVLQSEDDLVYSELTKISISNNSSQSVAINSSRFLRLLSWNNSGLTVEFYNTA